MSMSLGLESLDLDFQESKVYVTMLALGPISLGELIQNTEFTSEDVVKSIDSLRNKGYVHEIPGVALRFVAHLPFKELKSSAEITISQVETLAAQLDAHIEEKLGIILNKLREESQKISEGLNSAQNTLKQAEMKGEGDAEARISKYALEIEQTADQTKNSLAEMIQAKQSDHQSLVGTLKDAFKEKTRELETKFQATNQTIHEKYQSGISEFQNRENTRNQELTGQVGNLVSETQNSLSEGVKNVNLTMEKTGQTLIQSIDERNERISSQMANFTTNLTEKITQVGDTIQQSAILALESCNENIQQQITSQKQEAVTTFTTSRDEIKSNTINSAQAVQQTVNNSLTATQEQLFELLKQVQETIADQLSEARNKVESSILEFSEAVKAQTDSGFQKVVNNTESSFGNFAQNVQTTSEKSREEVTTSVNNMVSDSKIKANEIRSTAEVELKQVVDTLKTEVNSQLHQYKETLAPQEKFLNEELSKFQTEFTTSQTQTLENFNELMMEIKTLIDQSNQEIIDVISQETSILIENTTNFIEQINNQITEYDTKFGELLADSAAKGSERLIAQSQELKEKAISAVNDLAKIATGQLNTTNELITASIQAEITTFESELTDFTVKFKDITRQNDEMFRNYVNSLEKLANLVSETKHPTVQTAPIISKEATLSYIHDMFGRMKGGMTLLIPDINDIPVDLILATKTHQRITIVTLIDPTSHADFLKKLFQKPNVRIRRLDTTRFIGGEQYIASDRDGEEVILGIVEDTGRTVAIASQSDAFIGLIGKIVIGGTFLAQSVEITRASVGV
jgi:sugar-specific transcriptional regulator TrmB